MGLMKILSLAKRIVDALKLLLVELAANGKSLVGYILLQFPELSDFPGIVHALEQFAADPSKANAARLVVQIILVVGASHRSVKILRAVYQRLREL